MQIDAAWAALLGAGISSLFATITAIVVVGITKRSDERRHLRELIIKTAVENWKHVDQAATTFGGTRWPLDVYVIHMLKFSEILTKKNVTPEDLAKTHKDVNLLVSEAMRLAEILTHERTSGEPQQTERSDH